MFGCSVRCADRKVVRGDGGGRSSGFVFDVESVGFGNQILSSGGGAVMEF